MENHQHITPRKHVFLIRKIRFAIISLVFFVVASCGKNYTAHPIILEAERLLSTHPDSSRKLLLSIPLPQALPEADRAAWNLHYSHAMYKLLKEDSIPDSLIHIAIKYYDGSGLDKYAGTAHYVAGCLDQFHQRPQKALENYKKALTLLENTQEYNTRGLDALKIVYLYSEQDVIQEAKSYALKASRDFERSGNKNYLMYSYQITGDLYFHSDYPPDSSMQYYTKAARLAMELKDSAMLHFIQGKMGFVLYPIEGKKAISLFREAYKVDLRNQNLYNLYLSYTYAQLQMPDSATYFLRLAEKAKEGIKDSLAYFVSGSYIKGVNRDYRSAYQDLKKAYFLNEKSYERKVKNQLYRIDKQYDLTEKQKENLELKVANQNKELLISATVILLLGACVFSLIIRNKSKRRQAKLETKNKELQYEMEVRKLENKQKYDLLLSKLKQKLALTLEFRRMQDHPTPIEKQEEIMERIIRAVILHKTEWDYYVKEVDELSGNKLKAIQEKYKEVTKSDLIVVALLYLGINITDSCLLLGMTKETMYTRRKRIRKRLEIGEHTELEEWLSANIKPVEETLQASGGIE